jgi:hypothetical protein
MARKKRALKRRLRAKAAAVKARIARKLLMIKKLRQKKHEATLK